MITQPNSPSSVGDFSPDPPPIYQVTQENPMSHSRDLAPLINNLPKYTYYDHDTVIALPTYDENYPPGGIIHTRSRVVCTCCTYLFMLIAIISLIMLVSVHIGEYSPS